MALKLHRLTARAVETLKEPGRHSDGGNLFLVVGATGSKSWTFMFRQGARRVELGLGSVRNVPLAAARVLAEQARQALGRGEDPRTVLRPAAATAVPTFGQTADELIQSIDPGFRNRKHAAQWATTLGKTPYVPTKIRTDRSLHDAHVKALGELRSRPVDRVSTEDVLKVLRPIWQEAPETSSRVLNRIARVLDAARAQGHRTGENPARWKGHLDSILPARQKLSRGHHAAMPYTAVPDFIAQLRDTGGVAAKALEFTVLSAARTGETVGARWEEIDLVAMTWVVPATRTKTGKAHTVPLPDRAIGILEELAGVRQTDDPSAHVFPGHKAGKGLSTMAMAMLLRRLGESCTVHGFRSSFRDFCGEETSVPREIAEAALGHALQNRVEAAYRRGTALVKRRALMTLWANYVEPKAGNVIALHGHRS